MLMSIGQMIKEARIRKGMTQVELAKEIGCDDDSIFRWEKEVNKPLPVFVGKLERVLGVCLKEDRDDSPKNKSPSPG